MANTEVSRAPLGRVTLYLEYLNSLADTKSHISATAVAKGLGLGDVQVRKDLNALCGKGKPKTGYEITDLIKSLNKVLDSENGSAVIVGAGKLGTALLDYSGFSVYGLNVSAAFDNKIKEPAVSQSEKPILPLEKLSDFCRDNNVKIGIIAVPKQAAQEVCDMLCKNGIKAIWCFAQCQLSVPENVIVQYENMALSLAHLKMQIK